MFKFVVADVQVILACDRATDGEICIPGYERDKVVTPWALFGMWQANYADVAGPLMSTCQSLRNAPGTTIRVPDPIEAAKFAVSHYWSAAVTILRGLTTDCQLPIDPTYRPGNGHGGGGYAMDIGRNPLKQRITDCRGTVFTVTPTFCLAIVSDGIAT